MHLLAPPQRYVLLRWIGVSCVVFALITELAFHPLGGWLGSSAISASRNQLPGDTTSPEALSANSLATVHALTTFPHSFARQFRVILSTVAHVRGSISRSSILRGSQSIPLPGTTDGGLARCPVPADRYRVLRASAVIFHPHHSGYSRLACARCARRFKPHLEHLPGAVVVVTRAARPSCIVRGAHSYLSCSHE